MALQATLYRFRIDLSDIDRSLYDTIDIRLAMHPSETPTYLLTRLLAYVLNYQPGLEFSPQGLGDPDPAPLSIADPRGGVLLWIEIGQPSSKRVHMASKASKKLKVYTYKDLKSLYEEMRTASIFQFEKIEFFSLKPDFLNLLASHLERNNDWSIIYQDGSINVTFKNQSIQGEVEKI